MRRSRPSRDLGHAAGPWLVVATVLGSIAAGRDEPAGGRPAPPQGLAGARTRADVHGDPLPTGAVARFGTVRHRQETPIWQIVYSPDGRLVATEGDDPEVRIWDGRDGRLIRRIDVGPALIRALAFSPDSRTLAIASYRIDRERAGYVVDVTYAEAATGTQIVRGPWPEQDSVGALAISPDPAVLATGTAGGTLRLRDAQDGRELARFLVDRREIRRLAFDRRGDRLAALSRHEQDRRREVRVDVVDVRNRAVLRVIPDLRWGERLTLSPEGRLVCVSERYQVQCLDAGSGQPVPIGQIWGEDVAFSADGRLMADFHWPKVDVHDVATGATVAAFEGPGSHPTAWALSPDGATVAASGGPTTLHLWEIATGRDRLAVRDAHSEPVRCLTFTPDGRTLITGADDRTVRLWDAATGAQRKVLQLAGRPRTLTLSPDARLLIVGAEDNGWVFTWDLAGPDKAAILLDRFNAEGHPLGLRYSPADRSILIAWSDGRLLEGDTRGGKLREWKPARFAQDSAIERSVANRFRSGVTFAGGSRIGVVGREKGLKVVDLVAGRPLWDHADATIVAASSDGKTVAVALQADDPYYQRESFLVMSREEEARVRRPPRIGPERPGATIVLLDGEAGKERLRVPVPEATVWGLAFAPDGKTLAVTCDTDGNRARIRLFQAATGGPVRALSAPPISGPGLAFSPDGSRLAAAMADTSVLLWDLRPGP